MMMNRFTHLMKALLRWITLSWLGVEFWVSHLSTHHACHCAAWWCASQRLSHHHDKQPECWGLSLYAFPLLLLTISTTLSLPIDWLLIFRSLFSPCWLSDMTVLSSWGRKARDSTTMMGWIDSPFARSTGRAQCSSSMVSPLPNNTQGCQPSPWFIYTDNIIKKTESWLRDLWYEGLEMKS